MKIKGILSATSESGLNHLWLLLFRVLLSLFFLTHGMGKLNMLLEGNGAQFPDPFGLGGNFSLLLAVLGEVVAPVLIILGLGTRLAVIPAIVTMVVAVFVVHGSDPFQKKEMGLLYLLGFLTILIFGPGRYSLDALFSGKKK